VGWKGDVTSNFIATETLPPGAGNRRIRAVRRCLRRQAVWLWKRTPHKAIPASNHKTMRASVILCTRNRSDSVGETLQASLATGTSRAEILAWTAAGDWQGKGGSIEPAVCAKYILELKRGCTSPERQAASFEDAPDFVAMGNFRRLNRPKIIWATQIDLL